MIAVDSKCQILESVQNISIYIMSLYIIKRFHRRRQVKNRGVGGGVPLKPETFGFVRSLDLFEVWVCLKFGFVRSLGLFEVWVCSKFGFVRKRTKYIYCDVIFLENPVPGRSNCVLVILFNVYDEV